MNRDNEPQVKDESQDAASLLINEVRQDQARAALERSVDSREREYRALLVWLACTSIRLSKEPTRACAVCRKKPRRKVRQYLARQHLAVSFVRSDVSSARRIRSENMMTVCTRRRRKTGDESAQKTKEAVAKKEHAS